MLRKIATLLLQRTEGLLRGPASGAGQRDRQQEHGVRSADDGFRRQGGADAPGRYTSGTCRYGHY